MTVPSAPDLDVYQDARVDGPRPSIELLPVSNDAMRARRHPRAIALVYLFEALSALVVAWPASSLVGSFYGDHARGDAPLWAPGGAELLDLGTRAHPTPVVAAALLVALFVSFAGLVPMAALIGSIAFATRERGSPPMHLALARAMAVFPRLALLQVVVVFVQAVLVAIGAASSATSSSAFSGDLGEARADQIGWVALGIFLLLAAALGVVHDTARVAVVRFRVGILRALRIGFTCFRRAVLLWSWGWRALAALVLVALGSMVAARLGGAGGAALLALMAVHQAIVLARVALRASWLARALRAVDKEHKLVALTAPPAE